MAWKVFKGNKDKNEEGLNSEFTRKIDNALFDARNDKKDASNEIGKIRTWAAEAIVETYADIFPNGHLTYYREKYKDDALEKYEQIKKDNAEKIGIDKAEKCDKIVKAYMTQIKLRESKVKLYDKLVKNYEQTKEKLKEVELKQIEDNKINKHEERLKQLDGADDDFVEAVTDTAQMEELVNEFELKAEYAKQLSLLNKKYKDDSVEDYTTSLAFKEEIDKMIDEID